MTNLIHLVYETLQKEAAHSCSFPWVLDYAVDLPGTNITFHLLMTIIAAILTFSTICICVYLSYIHMTCWTRPMEQKQIVRIIWFLPIYSILALLPVWFYHVSGFLIPIGQWIEGFALNALFLFYVEIVCPSGTTREAFFHDLERRGYRGERKGDQGSLQWFRVINMMVFQLFFTRIVTTIATELIFGLSCPLSDARKWGQTATSIVQALSTGVAILGCLIIEKRFRPQMSRHLALSKLASFKVVVILDALQVLLFPTFAEHGVYMPTPPYHVGYNDFALALPNFLLVIELFICAISFLWAFNASHYRHQPRTHEGNIWTVLWDIVNITDIWAGVAYAFWVRVPSSWFHEDGNGREELERDGGRLGKEADEPIDNGEGADSRATSNA